MRKTKSLFMIYSNLESILVPGKIGKENRGKFYTDKYQCWLQLRS